MSRFDRRDPSNSHHSRSADDHHHRADGDQGMSGKTDRRKRAEQYRDKAIKHAFGEEPYVIEDPRLIAASRMPTEPARLVGAAFGAFTLCFVACAATAMLFPQLNESVSSVFWLIALVAGGIGGYRYPRTGYVCALLWLLVMNVGIAMVITDDPQARLAFFIGFLVIEFAFLSAGFIARDRH